MMNTEYIFKYFVDKFSVQFILLFIAYCRCVVCQVMKCFQKNKRNKKRDCFKNLKSTKIALKKKKKMNYYKEKRYKVSGYNIIIR